MNQNIITDLEKNDCAIKYFYIGTWKEIGNFNFGDYRIVSMSVNTKDKTARFLCERVK
jgi:hypothetical protein